MEKASDLELALFLSEHIKQPCNVKIPGYEQYNIREFYIRLARESINKMKNQDAADYLKNVIEGYS